MSHKASYWLAEVPPGALNAHAFRVLFHLCDAHNSARDPETACFPSQALLMDKTGLSNGGLNNAINAIEAAGLIRRRRTRNADGTRGPTYYILGCDFSETPPTPSGGGGPDSESTPDEPVDNSASEAAANSISRAEPTPFRRSNQLHVGGDKQVIDPVNKPRAQARAGAPACTRGDPGLAAPAKLIQSGKTYLCNGISAQTARRCIAAGLVSETDCRRVNIRL